MVSLRWRRPEQTSTSESRRTNSQGAQTAFLQKGNLQYAVEKAENNSNVSYQEVSGAPVETRSTLGYHVGPITIIFLNLSKMVGTGVYSTPASILKGTGSVGLSLIYWFIGFLMAASGLSVYLEYAAYFPNRSGSEVVYLEQAYPRPRYLFPITFAVQTVLLSFSSSNAIVLAQYLFRINGHDPSAWQLKGVAIGAYTLAFLFVAFNTRFSYFLSNAIGFVKVATLVFVAITGLVVLGGHTRVEDPHANFRNAFESSTGTTPYGITNALVKIVFSYMGYENAFNVVNEVKNPVRSIRTAGSISLFCVAVLYMLANIAYFAAVPKEELVKSTQVAASLFFQHVFGQSGAVRGLNFLIALSAFGNLLAVLLGQSRLIRECGRQGALPFASFWVSTRPFGTPLGPYFVKWAMTMLTILAPPAGDAFNFVVDLANYPASLFAFLMALGLYLVRWRRKKLGMQPLSSKEGGFRAWHVAILFTIAVNLFMLVMPWYPPATGATGGDVSFWYGTYVVTGIGIIIACFVYYAFWLWILPRFRGYRIRHEKLVLEGGEVTHKLVKVPVDQLEHWDATHDAYGAEISRDGSSDEDGLAARSPEKLTEFTGK
ncbi:High-affinity methionine permease [Exophiala dermatitidis]